MDLPTCPACGQSVLDDDAEDCPFCGASMSGKPSGKPAPQKAASTKTAAKKEAPEKAVSEKTAPKKSVAETELTDDDPFAVQKPDTKQAIPVSPRPTKKRQFRIKCPMCESVGYVPLQASEQEVKCYNKECMVPLYTAPFIEEPKEEEEPEPEGLSMAVFSAIAVGAIVMIGAGIWFFVLRDTGPKPNPDSLGTVTGTDVAKTTDTEEKTDTEKKDGTKDGEKEPVKVVEVSKIPEWQQSAFQQMHNAAFEVTNDQTRVNSRRLVAESAALLGNLEETKKQIQGLRTGAGSYSYYEITPLVKQTWLQLEAGQEPAAAQTLQEAIKASSQLREDLYSAEAVIELCTLLVHQNKMSEAETLLESNRSNDPRGRLAALLSQESSRKRFAFWKAVDESPVFPSRNPERVAITVALAERGEIEKARLWATQAKTPQSQGDCLTAWGRSLVRNASAEEGAKVAATVEKAAAALPAMIRARILAGVAAEQIRRSQPAGTSTVESALKLLKGATGTTKPPTPKTIPELLDFQPKKFEQVENTVHAAAEVARVQALLKQNDAAWQSFQIALSQTRSLSPALAFVDDRLETLTKSSESIKSELKREYNLKTDDQTRLKFLSYRDKLKELQRVGEAQLATLAELMSAAATWSIQEKAWQEVQSRNGNQNLHERELYHQTGVPFAFNLAFRLAGDLKGMQQSAQMIQQVSADDAKLERLAHTAQVAVWDQKFSTAAQALSTAATLNHSARMIESMKLTSQLVGRKEISQANSLASAFQDRFYSEMALNLIGTEGSAHGQAEAIWKLSQSQNLSPEHQVFLKHGFLVGTTAKPAPDSPDEKSPEPTTAPAQTAPAQGE